MAASGDQGNEECKIPVESEENYDQGNRTGENNSTSRWSSCMDFWCKPPSPEIGICDLLLGLLPIILSIYGFLRNSYRLLDLGKNGKWWHFWTLLVPWMVMEFFIYQLSSWWSEKDYDNKQTKQTKGFWWIGWRTLAVGNWIDAREIYKTGAYKECLELRKRQAIMSRIKLLYTFLSTGPQLVFKIYCSMNEKQNCSWIKWNVCLDIDDLFNCLLLLLSLTISIMSLSMDSKHIRYKNKHVCYGSAVMGILSQLCFLSSRVVALACLFSNDEIVGFITCVFFCLEFYMVMTYLEDSETNMNGTITQKFIYRMTMSLAHLIWYTDIEDNISAMLRYTIYYGETFIFALCYITVWPYFFILTFFIGVIFQYLNHYLFNPFSGRLYQSQNLLEWEKQLKSLKEKKI